MFRRAVFSTLCMVALLAASTRLPVACSCEAPGPACQSYWKTEVRRGRVYTFSARDRQSRLLPLQAPHMEIGPRQPEPVRIVIRRDPD
jgi:hypothetical protein